MQRGATWIFWIFNSRNSCILDKIRLDAYFSSQSVQFIVYCENIKMNAQLITVLIRSN